jgi:DNA polymerase
MEKIYILTECNYIACAYYENCCKCATEIVKNNSSDKINILFIGQGAGAKEDQVGRPFQGPAGRVLRKKIIPHFINHNINIILDNTIRCRPLDANGKNRPPTEKEFIFCINFIWQRIETFKPIIIVTLGKSASESMIPSTKGMSMTACRGKIFKHSSHIFLPTFHPAAVLHCTDESRKSELSNAIDQDIDMAVNMSIN